MKRVRVIMAGIALAAVGTGGSLTAASTGSSPRVSSSRAAVVPTARATVGGKTEPILVDSKGRPLSTYRADTASKSFVSGGLARLWPQLISLTSPAVAGPSVTGKVGPFCAVVGDHAGQVTGEGVQNFFVATPGITSIRAAAGSAPPVAPAAPASGYGY